ncbi:hypothetical protein LJR034_003040 [Caballeronia sp. LjRoot34]
MSPASDLDNIAFLVKRSMSAIRVGLQIASVFVQLQQQMSSITRLGELDTIAGG